MRLLLLLLLLLAIIAARSSSSSSRGSSSSRSSSRSSSSSSRSSSSSSRSSSSSGGLFSGSSSRSKSRTSSSGSSSSSGSWSLSNLFKSSKSSSSSSIGAKHSRGKSAAREQVASGSSIFSSSRSPKIGSRGYSAARASVIGSPSTSTSSSTSGTTKQSSFQKIRGKITEAAKKHLPSLALKAAKKGLPKLASYISRRRTKTGLRVGGGSTTTVYYPSGGHYQSSSYRLSSGSVPQQTHYELDRQPRIHNETRFTEVETRDPSAEEIFIPYNDDLLAQCPEKVDAFLQMENISFVFEDHHMFLVDDGMLNQTVAIYDLFPGGIHKVDAAVYDSQFEIVLLFREREVYGFHWNDTEDGFKALSGFPKTLPQSISFKPTAAFTWPDGYPILVSEKGEAAAYDAYLNEEVKLANDTATYLENLPQPLRGISHWDGDTAAVFTDHQVYLYDLEQKNVVGEPESLADFLNCFYVDIPSADDKTE